MNIKNCPFCGGEATVELVDVGVMRPNNVKYECHNIVEKLKKPSYTATYACGCNNCSVLFIEDSYFHLEDDGTIIFDKDGYMDSINQWNNRI